MKQTRSLSLSLSLLLSIAASLGGVAKADGPPGSPACSNGIDDDGDGRVDGVDSDCNTAGESARGWVRQRTSLSAHRTRNTEGADLASRASLIAADVDADGRVELIGAAADGSAFIMFDAVTLEEKARLTGFSLGALHPGVAAAQLVEGGPMEIAFMARSAGGVRLHVASLGTEGWSVVSGPKDGFASAASTVTIRDLDNDGEAELLAGAGVYRFDRVIVDRPLRRIAELDVAAHEATLGVPPSVVAADIDVESPGLELALGGTLARVSSEDGIISLEQESVPGVSMGSTMVADLHGDGIAEVIVTTPEGISVWGMVGGSPRLEVRWPVLGPKGAVVVADVTNQDLADDGVANESTANPNELLVLAGGRVQVYTAQETGGPLWSVAATDSRGISRLTAFDLNGDGYSEVLEQTPNGLRALFGGPLTKAGGDVDLRHRTYRGGRVETEGAASTAATIAGPIVADLSGDGHAELAIVSGGEIAIVEGTPAWSEVRSMWNEFAVAPALFAADGSLRADAVSHVTGAQSAPEAAAVETPASPSAQPEESRHGSYILAGGVLALPMIFALALLLRRRKKDVLLFPTPELNKAREWSLALDNVRASGPRQRYQAKRAKIDVPLASSTKPTSEPAKPEADLEIRLLVEAKLREFEAKQEREARLFAEEQLEREREARIAAEVERRVVEATSKMEQRRKEMTDSKRTSGHRLVVPNMPANESGHRSRGTLRDATPITLVSLPSLFPDASSIPPSANSVPPAVGAN